MTRANFEITVGTFRSKTFGFQSNSSAYPSYMLQFVVKAVQSAHSLNSGAKENFYTDIDSKALSDLIDDCGLTLGYVGNPSYYYIIDFFNKRLIIRKSQSYWVNAPENWEEKGWKGCYIGKNGRYGFINQRKGKIIFDVHFSELVGKFGEMKTVNINPHNETFLIV